MNVVGHLAVVINKNNKMKYPIADKFLIVVGWIAISPFVLKECVIRGFKWVARKIKKT